MVHDPNHTADGAHIHPVSTLRDFRKSRICGRIYQGARWRFARHDATFSKSRTKYSPVPVESNRSGPNQFHRYTSRCCDCRQAIEKEIGSLQIGTYPCSKIKSTVLVPCSYTSMKVTFCHSWMDHSNQDPFPLPASIWRHSP
jgi:hypothetical protein